MQNLKNLENGSILRKVKQNKNFQQESGKRSLKQILWLSKNISLYYDLNCTFTSL